MGRIGKIISNWMFLFRWGKEISRRVFVSAIIWSVLDIAEVFAVLILPKFVIDELTGQKRWETVLGYIALLIGILTLLRLLRLALQVFYNMAVNSGDVMTVQHYARFYTKMDYAKLEDDGLRDHQALLCAKMHVNLIAENIQTVLTNVLYLAGYAYIVFLLHPLVLVAVLLVALANYWLGFMQEKTKYAFQPEVARFTRRFDYFFETMTDFRFAKEVRINQASVWLAGRFSDELNSFSKRFTKYQNKMMPIRLAEAAMGFVQLLVMYGYTVYQAIAGSVTIGDFTVFTGAVLGLSTAFNGIASGLAQMYYMSKYVEDYKVYTEAVNASHLMEGTVKLSDETSENVIEFRNVTFRYPNTDRDVLKNISLIIRDKEKCAVVGVNGAGKSTFIKLLCRLYEPTEGVILYNGVDISTICYEDYIRKLSVVFQDFQLLAFSMEENIVLNQERNRNKVLEAARKSGLEGKLNRLPKGLDTSVGKDFDEEGVEFSGGEGQKLATARAYYKDAPIVILDEPTAALDPLSENQVYQRFHEIMKDKTAIFISHRLASTRFCDRIAVFEHGQVVEYGTHDQLMTQGGLYYQMFQRQAEYYKEGTDESEE